MKVLIIFSRVVGKDIRNQAMATLLFEESNLIALEAYETASFSEFLSENKCHECDIKTIISQSMNVK